MKLKIYLKSANKFINNLKDIDVKEIEKKIKSLNFEDIKNFNYSNFFYSVSQSTYTKPILGLSFAALLIIFLLIPKILFLNSSFRKLKQYEQESKNIENKTLQLKNRQKKFRNILLKMDEINSSFIKSQELVFLVELFNKSAKKSNVKINFFAPLENTETSNLCKPSISQRTSKEFKRINRRNKRSQKENISIEYFEINFSADYLDIIQFLKEIQLYDIVIIPHCLEVSGSNINLDIPTDNDEKISIIESVDNLGRLINDQTDTNKSDLTQNLGKVEARVVFKIPSSN